ncbi:MAG: hypothetical protein ACE5L6_00500 [Candidatus Bathyarchaeia archaeon]
MDLESLAITLMVTVGTLVVLARSREYKTSGSFLGMGIIWLLAALLYSLFKGNYSFDTNTPLFNIGLIFTIAGGAGLTIQYLREVRNRPF